MNQTRKIALCGMMSALSVVIMAIGAVLGIGIYAAPMLAGLLLLPLGITLGRKEQLLVWISASLLCLMLIGDWEQNLMYLCLFGLYPILYPLFQKLPKGLRLMAKLAYFNLITVAAEALVLLVLVPEPLSAGMILALLAVGNLTFLLYDRLIPLYALILHKHLNRIFK